MSSILKALKKVEEEKAAQRVAAPLASDVVRTRSRRPRTSLSSWTIAGACGVVAVAAVVSTYAAMGGFSGGRKDAAHETGAKTPVPAAKPDASPAATPAPSAQYASTAVPQAKADGVPAVVKKAVMTGVPSAPTPAAGKTTPAVAVKGAVVPPAISVNMQPQPFLRTSTGPVSLRQGSSDFKVSGIAWQKESSARLAIVNGLAVTQGATVDGAKVLEILPDRVRLLQDERQFEIHMGKISH
jgi:general secretion pathway protein B